jgi:hypothetical protein
MTYAVKSAIDQQQLAAEIIRVGVAVDTLTALPLEDLTVSAAELNKLDGAGAVVASGTQVANIVGVATNLANDANGTAIAAAVNANAVAINAIIAALEEFLIADTE